MRKSALVALSSCALLWSNAVFAEEVKESVAMPLPPPAPKGQTIDVALMGGGHFMGTALKDSGPGGAVAVGTHYRVGRGVAGAMLRGGFEYYSLDPYDGAPADVSLSRDAFTVGIQLLYAFRPLGNPWSMYLHALPQALFERTTFQHANGRSEDASATLFAVGGGVGLRIRAGSGAIFVEATWRQQISKKTRCAPGISECEPSQRQTVNLSGLVHQIGYVVSF